MANKTASLKVARDFIKFVDACPSPYQVVEECKSRLVSAGFKEIRERDHWNVKPNDKCFVTRNQSTIIAFAVGGQYKPGNGYAIVGAHTDSPCLRVKVKSTRVKQGFIQVGTECYGGGNWPSWFDRDLKVAGRLLVRDEKNVIQSKLVHIDRPVMRVPHLAIHLQREMNDKFSTNKETQLVPILATQSGFQLNQCGEAKSEATGCSAKHHSAFIQMLSQEVNASPDQIVDLDLFLADYQPSAIGGVLEDFIFAPRLDNLLSSYCSLVGLIESCNAGLDKETSIRMVALFDNEEVGSQSAQGAGSSITEYVMRRLSADTQNSTAFEESIPKSMMISADMAHGIHPNYADKHEENFKPTFDGGPVIKTNNNQRYATTAITATIVREAARYADVPVQDVMVRNDSPCGSTIGPILSTRLGMRTADVGAAQLSMHSCREVCGVYAPEQCLKLYRAFYENFTKIDAALNAE
uniref:Aspartyl aminopeptidase n=1 Tax=Phallusia mammillata TaxID=59560 RepID=A0A6F9DBF5_9ASCI|nr:aspartyl aminopeptidase-like [Phallusia mammillata]